MKAVNKWTLISILAVTGACNSDPIETDFCPDDPYKTAPGICGCGVSDVDEQGNINTKCLNTIITEIDLCPNDDRKTQPGLCGCGESDFDAEGKVRTDCTGKDLCPNDPSKTDPGICGCGESDVDSDGDGMADCKDGCASDPEKTRPGICGCMKADTLESVQDSDGDTVIDCLDGCPLNADKTEEGAFGCDVSDSDNDGVKDVDDACPYNPNIQTLPEEADKSACNFVEEEGKKIFQVWSAGDFKTLQAEIDKSLPDAPLNMLCDPAAMTSTICIDNNHKLVCTHDSTMNIDTYQLSGCTSCAQEVIPPETEGGEPTYGDYKCTFESAGNNLDTIHLYQQCADSMPKLCAPTDQQSNPATQLVCSNGLVTQNTCYGGCDPSTHQCRQCKGEPTTNGTIENQCCNVGEYEEKCSGAKARRCIGGLVKTVTCMESCESSFAGDANVRCIQAASVPEPTFTVKLMNDIDLSSAYTKTIYDTCIVNWTPLNLYRITFDGNGHTIKATQNDQSCAIAHPLFENIVDSRVNHLTLAYDLIGRPSGALATWAYHSEINEVAWKASARITNPFFGEKYNGFGGLVSMARQTLFNKAQVDSKITVESPSYHAAGFVYKGEEITVRDSSVNSSFFKCGAQDCSGVFDTLSGTNHILNFTTDFGQYVYGEGTAHASGFANLISAETRIDNLKHKIEIVNQTYGTEGDFYGITKDLAGYFNDLEINFERVDINGVFTGVATAINRITGKFAITLGSIKSNKSISGVGVISDTADLKSCEINAGTLESPVSYGIGSSIAGKLNQCEISVESIKGKSGFGLSETFTESSELNGCKIGIKTVVGEESASGIGHITGTLKSSEIKVDTVQSTGGPAYGIGITYTPAERDAEALNSFEVGSVSGKQAYGVAQTIKRILSKDTYIIHEVKAEENAFGVAQNIGSTRNGATFTIDEVTSTGADVYGVAHQMIGGSVPAKLPESTEPTTTDYNNLTADTITIGELSSQAGKVYCIADIIQTDFDVVSINHVEADKDVMGIFGPSAYVNVRDLSLQVKTIKSANGNVYLAGDAFNATNNEKGNKFDYVRINVDNAEGVQVMPFGSITVNNSIQASISNVAIYTNARYTQPTPILEDETPGPMPNAILFANQITAYSPSTFTFNSIAVSSNYSYCPNNKCTTPEHYSFVQTKPSNLNYGKLFWYDRAKIDGELTQLDPDYPVVTGFNSDDIEIMTEFSDNWFRKLVVENEKEIIIPWIYDFYNRKTNI